MNKLNFKKLIFLALASSIMLPASLMAQEDTEDASDFLYTEDMGILAEKEVGYYAEGSFFAWHGYLNFEFDAVQGKHSNFDNHEFYLSAQSRISDLLSVVAEFEYEHTPEKLILPIQAYADLKIFDELQFRAGLFYTPMGIPRTYNLRGNRNRMIRQVALTHDIMYENWSEVGIGIYGQFRSGLFYDIALGNGMPNTIKPGDSWFDAHTSLQSHTEDNNENKAFHGRAGYSSTNFLNGIINVAISGGYQKYDPANEKRMIHFGADMRFIHKSGVRFQGEIMTRSGDEHEEDLAAYGVSMNALGQYAQLSRRIVSKKDRKFYQYIEPVYQLDYIDLNVGKDSAEPVPPGSAPLRPDLLTNAVGIVFCPVPYFLAKFEYDFVKEINGPQIENNVLWFSVVVEF